MANSVSFKVIIDDNNTLKIVANNANKAKKAIEGVGEATERAGKSRNTYNRREKGAAQNTSNGTKAYAKMAQTISSGLVPAYATLAANVFAISAAFQFLKSAADVRILEKTQVSYANSTGMAMQTVTQSLREASDGMLGFKEAAQAASIGVAKGFSPAQLEKLAVGARKASAALGRDFEDSFDRLIRGASKAEPELLDELGITLKLETATRRYADAMNISEKSMTAAQKSQAVLLETQRQLDELFGQQAAETNPFVKLQKTFSDLIRTGTDMVMPLFEGIAGILNRSGAAAIAVFGSIALSIVKMAAKEPFDQLKSSMDNWAQKAQESVNKAKAAQESYQQEIRQTQKELEKAAQASVKTAARGAMKAGGSGALIAKAAKGTLTDPKQIGQLKSLLKKAELEYKLYGTEIKGVLKGMSVEQVVTLRKALEANGRDHMSFHKKMEARWKTFILNQKVGWARIKTMGVTTFNSLARAATKVGNAMNKALSMAGFIGILVMIYEAIKAVMEAPYTIAMNVAKGIDTVIGFLVKGINFVLEGFGTLIDNILNGYKGIYNLIAGSSLGKKLGLEEMNDESTFFADSMKGLIKYTGSLSTTLEQSDFGGFLKGLEDSAVAARDAEERFDSLMQKIKSQGSDWENISKGIRSASGAMRNMGQATAISTLGLSGTFEAISRIEDAEKRTEALNAIKKNMSDIGILGPKFQAAFDSGDVEALRNLELAAAGALSNYRALKDSAESLNSAMKSNDFTLAESLLGTIGATADAAAGSFKNLGIGTDAVNKVIKEYEELAAKSGMTTSQLTNYLRDLRVATEELAISQALLSTMTGRTAQEGKLRLDIVKQDLELKELALKFAKEEDAVIKQQIANQIQLAGIKRGQMQAQLDSSRQGQFSQDQAQMSTNVAATGAALADPTLGMSEKITALEGFISPMTESLASLGPQGEAMSMALEGAFTLGETFASAFEKISAGSFSLQDGLGMAAAAVQGLAQIQAAQSKMAIAAIDKEIEAEKQRDGKSAESVAKLKSLEAKKDAMKRKAFETDKKMKLAGAIIATAQGITQALASAPAPFNMILAGMVGAMGMAQVAAIQSMTYQGGGSGGSTATPTSVSVGSRQNVVDTAKARSPSGELAYARGAQGMGQGMTNFTPAFTGMKYRAGGGETAGFVVGEQGPELFVPDRPGRIIPADETASAQGQPINANINISAVDAAGVEEVLVNQRPYIIAMLREAANAHGEPFMEKVNETAMAGGARKGGRA